MTKRKPVLGSGCLKIEVECPDCGKFSADVNVVGSILLRRRPLIDTFILRVHQEAMHGRPFQNGTNQP